MGWKWERGALFLSLFPSSLCCDTIVSGSSLKLLVASHEAQLSRTRADPSEVSECPLPLNFDGLLCMIHTPT